jgi:hypothetical protein
MTKPEVSLNGAAMVDTTGAKTGFREVVHDHPSVFIAGPLFSPVCAAAIPAQIRTNRSKKMDFFMTSSLSAALLSRDHGCWLLSKIENERIRNGLPHMRQWK